MLTHRLYKEKLNLILLYLICLQKHFVLRRPLHRGRAQSGNSYQQVTFTPVQSSASKFAISVGSGLVLFFFSLGTCNLTTQTNKGAGIYCKHNPVPFHQPKSLHKFKLFMCLFSRKQFLTLCLPQNSHNSSVLILAQLFLFESKKNLGYHSTTLFPLDPMTMAC